MSVMKKCSALILCVLILMMTVVSGCDTGQNSSDDDVYYIGFSAPLTGQCAKSGEDMVNGAKLAIEEINAAGGVLGKTFELVVEDDGGDPTQAVQAANKLVSKDVDCAMGYYHSGACNPCLPVYNRAGTPVILCAVASTNLTRQGFENIVRIQGHNDQQGEVAARFMIENKKAKRIAIISDGTSSPRGQSESAVEWANKLDSDVELLVDQITPGEKDFASIVTKIKAFNPDAVFFTGFYAEGSIFLKQLRGMGVTCQYVVGDGNTDPSFIEVAGADAEGTVMTSPPMSESLPGSGEFIQKYTNKYGVGPAAYSVYCYDACYLLKDAITRANSTEKAEVIKALRATEGFEAITGTISFDENGDLTTPGYVLLVVKDGKFVPYED